MLACVEQHRRNRSDNHTRAALRGQRTDSERTLKAAAGRVTAASAGSAPDISSLAHWVLDGHAAMNTHGAQPGIDGYMAGCRCRRCCAAQLAREHQISAHFGRRYQA